MVTEETLEKTTMNGGGPGFDEEEDRRATKNQD